MEGEKREGVKYVCDLPAPGPWRLTTWDGGVVATSPHHSPRFIKGGEVTVLDAVPKGM